MYDYSPKESGSLQMGMGGADNIESADGTVNGQWFAIQALGGDATVTATDDNGDDLSGVTIPNGVTVYGKFSQISCSAGTARCYKRG